MYLTVSMLIIKPVWDSQENSFIQWCPSYSFECYGTNYFNKYIHMFNLCFSNRTESQQKFGKNMAINWGSKLYFKKWKMWDRKLHIWVFERRVAIKREIENTLVNFLLPLRVDCWSLIDLPVKNEILQKWKLYHEEFDVMTKAIVWN